MIRLNYLASVIRKNISPSILFEIRNRMAFLRELIGRLFFWYWIITRFQMRSESPFNIVYAGRKSNLELAQVLLGAGKQTYLHADVSGQTGSTVWISEMPLPGALCLPHYVRVIVRLGRPVAEITSEFGDALRRVIRQRRADYIMVKVQGDAAIEKADKEMFQPYASARYGAAVSHIGSGVIRKMAERFGWFHLVQLSGEVVACQIGGAITCAKKRYWTLIRCGYPEQVFSDAKALHETNTINFFLALECAAENYFDYFDLGSSLARPEDGLLQWKKRWRGDLSVMGNHGYFHVRLPKIGKSRFLWESPLFAVEKQNLTLHLGLPFDQEDDAIVNRYREMNFEGLFCVYLYCARSCGTELLNKLKTVCFRQLAQPAIKIISST